MSADDFFVPITREQMLEAARVTGEGAKEVLHERFMNLCEKIANDYGHDVKEVVDFFNFMELRARAHRRHDICVQCPKDDIPVDPECWKCVIDDIMSGPSWIRAVERLDEEFGSLG